MHHGSGSGCDHNTNPEDWIMDDVREDGKEYIVKRCPICHEIVSSWIRTAVEGQLTIGEENARRRESSR